jgi:DUF4097 and DUF4098 domain-containing protein YvlB
MHSRAWTLMAVLAVAAPLKAAELRVVTDDDWCNRDGDLGGRRERYCEVRETSWRASGPVKADSRPNGGIEVKGGGRDDVRLRVRVTATGATAEEARALASQVRVETDGGVRIIGPESRTRDRNWSASIRLDVPNGSELELQADNGGIHIGDFNGRAKFNTVNGGIHLEDVGGRMEGATVNGGLHVSLTGSEWDGEGLDVSTTNGGVHLDIPKGYNARLQTGTVNGGVHSDLPFVSGRHGRTGAHIETDLGRGGPLLRLETTNGGLHISQD